MSPRILVVDDEHGIREQLTRWLSHEGYRTEQAASGKEALEALRKSNINVVLLDLRLPDMDGFRVLEKINQDYPDICVIVLTAFGTDDSPARARAAGAFDFFPKPIHFESLIHRIDTAADQFMLQRESEYQREETKRQFQFENIIGSSAAMQRVFDIIQKVADSDETILLQGENGTGKDLLAGAIHYNSSRRAKPLIVADCAALPESLAESELFGHEKGAFTDAKSRRIGKFERGHATTIFVNEIGELSAPLQMKFLRFLQEKTCERIGSTAPIEVDARIIAATNKNLAEAVAQGKFREDLFHRLSRVLITVPPLRERRDDIPLLIKHFIKRYNRLNGKFIEGIARPALELLERYHFPGNVRELENIIASAMLLEDGNIIKAETIRLRLMPPDKNDLPDFANMTYREAKAEFDRIYLSQLLERAGGNVSKAARLADMDRSHVRTKLKDAGLRGTEDS